MANAIRDLPIPEHQKPKLKLYAQDLSGLKDIDVDDKCCFHIKVKAISKYREEYEPNNPLCITFEVTSVKKCEED